MGKIIYSERVIEKIDKLILALYHKNYFGYIESAKEYARHLYDFIDTIPDLQKRITRNKKFGIYFARFDVKNKWTKYYITYNLVNNIYYIENIFYKSRARVRYLYKRNKIKVISSMFTLIYSRIHVQF